MTIIERQKIGNNFFIPMPVVLVGTKVKGTVNFMAVGWCTRANADPPMIACGIGNHHHTPRGIAKTGTFSVNIPSRDLLEKTDYCGLVSGANVDKSQVFSVFYGVLKTAPMIRECPVTLECRLVKSVPLPTNTLYVGEIAAAYADLSAVKDGKPDFQAMDPLLLTMPDNTYWTLGSAAGKAWSAGLKLKKGSSPGRVCPEPFLAGYASVSPSGSLPPGPDHAP